jgi:N-acetylmuramoyl-L-alanine amidase
MARFPAAVWKPVDRYTPGGSSCQLMWEVNRIMFHTAVSNSESLYAMMAKPGTATSHFYVRKDGTVEQYVDCAYRSTACLEGNPDSITVESWDGYPHGWANGSDVPNWTDAQLRSLADLAAWAHTEYGVPLDACPDSKPGSRGVAYHRQGIDNWRVSGGQYWSNSRGKVCPGDRRVNQIGQIITMAADGGEDDMALDEKDLENIAGRVNRVLGDYNAKGEPRNEDNEDPEAGNTRLAQIEKLAGKP